ncbi:hypothetical protein TI39_contig350g00028 [Zymoseptoria brevis]|uniref:Uncharacterized protein n=1 Tax=Zymoseptoria brevis TaxID=1047168 RepID=A0A0F4GS14_9PEZI|nr:hypothetical protein TI39_contig350g00028 [Zymoseptoria brevis]
MQRSTNFVGQGATIEQHYHHLSQQASAPAITTDLNSNAAVPARTLQDQRALSQQVPPYTTLSQTKNSSTMQWSTNFVAPRANIEQHHNHLSQQASTPTIMTDLNSNTAVPARTSQAYRHLPQQAPTSTTMQQPTRPTAIPAPIIQHSRLLDLPPELRTAIYDLVLNTPELPVKPKTKSRKKPVIVDFRLVAVDSEGYNCPPLVSVSREVRHDALKLFYHSRTFSIAAPDFSDALIRRFHKNLKEGMGIRRKGMRFQVEISGLPNWKNLLKWLESNHSGTHSLRPKAQNEFLPIRKQRRDEPAFLGMFAMAKEMRGQDWELLKRLLFAMRPGLVALNDKWWP